MPQIKKIRSKFEIIKQKLMRVELVKIRMTFLIFVHYSFRYFFNTQKKLHLASKSNLHTKKNLNSAKDKPRRNDFLVKGKNRNSIFYACCHV